MTTRFALRYGETRVKEIKNIPDFDKHPLSETKQ